MSVRFSEKVQHMCAECADQIQYLSMTLYTLQESVFSIQNKYQYNTECVMLILPLIVSLSPIHLVQRTGLQCSLWLYCISLCLQATISLPICVLIIASIGLLAHGLSSMGNNFFLVHLGQSSELRLCFTTKFSMTSISFVSSSDCVRRLSSTLMAFCTQSESNFYTVL